MNILHLSFLIQSNFASLLGVDCVKSYSCSSDAWKTVIGMRCHNNTFLHQELHYHDKSVKLLYYTYKLIMRTASIMKIKLPKAWAYDVCSICFRHIIILVKHDCIIRICIVPFYLHQPKMINISLSIRQNIKEFTLIFYDYHETIKTPNLMNKQ